MATKNLYDAPGVNFTPGVFQGAGYEFQGPDVAIAERSLANLENRMNKAQEAKTNMDVALGKIQEQLHQDERTLAWFNQYKEDISNQIDNQIQEGNFGAALRTAIDLGGKTAKDSQIQNRIKDNEELTLKRKILEQDLNSGKINKDDYDYLIYTNNKEYLDRFDSEGNYKEEFINQQANYTAASASIDWSKELLNSKNLVEYKQHSETTAIGVPVTQADGSVINTTDTTSYSYTSLEAKRIKTTYKNRLNNDLRLSIEQDFNSKKYKLEQLNNRLNQSTDETEKRYIQKEIDNLNKVLLGTYTLEEYIDKSLDNQINMINESAYYRDVTKNIDKQTLGKTNNNGNNKSKNYVESPIPTDGEEIGVAETEENILKEFEAWQSSARGISGFFVVPTISTNLNRKNNLYPTNE